MKFIEVTEFKEENLIGMRIQCLWIFSISAMYNEKMGAHFNFGLGVLPVEVSFQLSAWSFTDE